MYRRSLNTPEFEDFYLPFGGKLCGDNRWVCLSKIIDWAKVEEVYASTFSDSGMGAPGKPARLALGALIAKERLGTSDEETVEQIRENPYLQYFLGLSEYSDEAPFDSSMFVHFRKRFSQEAIAAINEDLIKSSQSQLLSKDASDDEGYNNTSANPQNRGKIILDATCAPADIAYPTDLNLLNESREKAEKVIDILHAPQKGTIKKPRTYRRKARKDYLKAAKSRQLSTAKRRKAVRKQLGYLKRDLNYIKEWSCRSSLGILSKRQYQDLLVISELYRQQQYLYENNENRIDDRIVSISQPHVRPIVRGKASAKTEFGAKLSVSLTDGYVRLDRLSWDNFNESTDLITQVEHYKERCGYYPQSVHVDKIYRTRANRTYCNTNGIRMSGPPLGRPPKVTESNKEAIKNQKQIARQDELDRIPIEGKFGQGKRRFSLNRIMAKLATTSQSTMAIIFLVMNLQKYLKQILLGLYFKIFNGYFHRENKIVSNHQYDFRFIPTQLITNVAA
jgi:IS5 family transposase